MELAKKYFVFQVPQVTSLQIELKLSLSLNATFIKVTFINVTLTNVTFTDAE